MNREEATKLGLRLLDVTVPSGITYTIREQNGEDDDILSNPLTSRDLTNLDIFLAGIIVSPNLTVDQVLDLPSNDRYCLWLHSRIFSIGDVIEFEYDWGKENGGKMVYEADLQDFLFDYSKNPQEIPTEEFEKKSDAIPFYPMGTVTRELPIVLNGKELRFDLCTGRSEKEILKLSVDQRTKNKELQVRNLRMKVNEKWEKVERFSIFTKKEIDSIRKQVASVDPLFAGLTTLENPNVPGMTAQVNIFAIPGFFFPGE